MFEVYSFFLFMHDIFLYIKGKSQMIPVVEYQNVCWNDYISPVNTGSMGCVIQGDLYGCVIQDLYGCVIQGDLTTSIQQWSSQAKPNSHKTFFQQKMLKQK